MVAGKIFTNSHKYIRIICVLRVNPRHKCRISVHDLRDLDNRRQIDIYDLCNAKTYYTRFGI